MVTTSLDQSAKLFMKAYSREYNRGKYHCTIDLLFDWFGLACFANKNKYCQLSISWFQTSQTGGQRYSDTSHFSVPCLSPSCLLLDYEREEGGRLWSIIIIMLFDYANLFQVKAFIFVRHKHWQMFEYRQNTLAYYSL